MNKGSTKANVRAFNYEESIKNGLEIAIEDSIEVKEIEDEMIFSLDGGKPREFVLMAYLEGWDKDCTNVHMGAGFSLDMKFKVSEKQQY